jgi:acyl-CoA thioester hydrolase
MTNDSSRSMTFGSEVTTTSPLLVSYPDVLEIRVAWGEMDAFGHVNNVVYFRYMENARISYLNRCGIGGFVGADGVGPILASISCKFKVPVTFPDSILVGTRVVSMSDDRFTLSQRLVSTRMKIVVAEGEGVIVSYDYRLGRKAPIPDEVRAGIERMEAGVSQ